MLGLDLAALELAGAFALGAVLGAVAAVQLARALLELTARKRHRRR